MLNLELMRNRMRQKKLSYRKMAKLLGFTSSGTIHKWFSGKHQIKAKYLARIAEVLELPIQDLFINSTEDNSDHEGGDC